MIQAVLAVLSATIGQHDQGGLTGEVGALSHTADGLSIVAIFGILTGTALLATVALGLLTSRGRVKLKYHRAGAMVVVALAVAHGLMALLLPH